MLEIAELAIEDLEEFIAQGDDCGAEVPLTAKERFDALDQRLNGVDVRLGQIAADYGSYPRSRKIIAAVKDLGVIAAIYTVPLALIALVATVSIFAFAQWSAANKRLADDAIWRTSTDDRLKSIEKSLLEIRAEKAAASPTKSQSQADAADVLSSAEKSSITLPLAVVQDAGSSFVQAAKEDPGAWNVALRYAAYKTSLNTFTPGPAYIPHGFNAKYTVVSPNNSSRPKFRWLGRTNSKEDAARMDYIGFDKNKALEVRPQWLEAQGGALILDGEELRNVILIGVEVHYSGKPITLHNVMFLNCTFVFDNDANGRALGNQILSTSLVNFQSQG